MTIKFIAGHVIPQGGMIQIIFPQEYQGDLIKMKTSCNL
jgi:hypothetical protein